MVFGQKTKDAHEKKVEELKGTKMKINEFGKTYNEDSDGNILDASLMLKDGEIIMTPEFLKFIAHKSRLKDVIKGYFNKGIKEDIVSDENTQTYMISDMTGHPLLSMTFKITNESGFFSRNVKLEIDGIITTDRFKTEQTERIRDLIRGVRFLLIKDPVIVKTKGTINIRTNV